MKALLNYLVAGNLTIFAFWPLLLLDGHMPLRSLFSEARGNALILKVHVGRMNK